MRNPYKTLEQSLGYRFRQRRLLETALTHRSFRYETTALSRDNQRLEFLGDAVLDLLAAHHLFSTFPAMREGELTSLRSAIANSDTLARIASGIELGRYLKLGRGEQESGGDTRASNLADALESVMGAAFLDGGMKASRRIFDKLFLDELDAARVDFEFTNPKGSLQELVQRRWKSSPKYHIVVEEGPAHAKEFTAEVMIDGTVFGTGQGTSKQAAETAAAKQGLQALLEEERPSPEENPLP